MSDKFTIELTGKQLHLLDNIISVGIHEIKGLSPDEFAEYWGRTDRAKLMELANEVQLIVFSLQWDNRVWQEFPFELSPQAGER